MSEEVEKLAIKKLCIMNECELPGIFKAFYINKGVK